MPEINGRRGNGLLRVPVRPALSRRRFRYSRCGSARTAGDHRVGQHGEPLRQDRTGLPPHRRDADPIRTPERSQLEHASSR